MRSCSARSLVLTCSLLLTLPQGWCCTFAFQKPTNSTTALVADTPEIPVDVEGCCSCCPHKASSSTGPTVKPTPPEKPSAPLKSACCCPERLATLPALDSVQEVNTGFALFLPPIHTTPFSVGQRTRVDGTDPAPPHNILHVFNCVWLC
jgi:hypothetical protein